MLYPQRNSMQSLFNADVAIAWSESSRDINSAVNPVSQRFAPNSNASFDRILYRTASVDPIPEGDDLPTLYNLNLTVFGPATSLRRRNRLPASGPLASCSFERSIAADVT
jgi:hypothetical protein